MIERGTGGSIVFTSSGGGLIGYANSAAYVAAKHGVIGLMRTLALELAPYAVRVNAVCPGSVDTPMTRNDITYELFTGKVGATYEDAEPAIGEGSKLPVTWLDAVDISNAILYLVSDMGRYVTGVALPVDAGFILR
jgi:NAD(P)-dependent dehydrogenase (short-subunit alcohol dehydrogenase family)